MDQITRNEIQQRREEIYDYACRERIVRQAGNGRSRSLRGQIADGAQSLSDFFGTVAEAVRNKDASS